ncbi:MAG: c-type cytochrome [Pseudomonadota bacterium]
MLKGFTRVTFAALSLSVALVATLARGVDPAPSAATPAAAPAVPAAAAPPIELPEWLFPVDPNSLVKNPQPVKLDDVEQLDIPGSDQKFTQARINDPYNAPDWHPNDHIPMPDIVAKGRKPAAMACAYCHTPTGQGRPENSALAGLPEGYIKEQLLDMRSGKRKPTGPEVYKPSWAMHALAKNLTDAEIDESAKYFAQQKLKRRHYIIESLRIPRAERAAWIYEEVGGTEDLEGRLLEVTSELVRHERRDDRLQYTVYVPPGSQARGKRLATKGEGEEKGAKTQVCATCHLANLKGTDKIPPIAGRSPTYLLRQMLAFRNGTRVNEVSPQMTPVLEKLTLADMVDLAAYVGSLYP